MVHRLRVATWNCFGTITSLQGLLLARPRWPERLVSPALARALAAWDVVCVQENFLPFVSTALEEVAHEAGMHFWCDRDLAAVAERSFFGGGLAILSRQAPRSVSFTTFEGRAHGFDAYACKGFAVAEFEVPAAGGGGIYRVVNAHLQADDTSLMRAGLGGSHEVRAAQIERLMDALDPAVPTLVAGDLNVEFGSEEYHRVLRPALARRRLRDHCAEHPLLTFDPTTNDLLRAIEPSHPAMRLDYLLSAPGRDPGRDPGREPGRERAWRERTRPRLVLAEPLDERLEGGRGRLFASDHYGLGVVMELAPLTAQVTPQITPWVTPGVRFQMASEEVSHHGPTEAVSPS